MVKPPAPVFVNGGSVPPWVDDALGKRIIIRRRQMLLHSHLKVIHKFNVIDDKTFKTWSDELEDLQAAWGAHGFNFYDDLFDGYSLINVFDLAEASRKDDAICQTAIRMMMARKALKREKEPSPL